MLLGQELKFKNKLCNFKRVPFSVTSILLCPTLQACDCDLFRTTPPEGWQSYYMGGGNFLIVKDTYTEIFSQLDPYDLYGQWKDILIEKIK